MSRWSLVASTLVLLVGAQTCAAGDGSQLSDVWNFLEQNVVGKTVRCESQSPESDFVRTTTFANLVQTSEGFRLDQLAQIEQTVFDLDDTGKRNNPGRSLNRVVVARYEVSARESTGELIGLQRIISSTQDDATGKANSVRVSMDDGKLVIESSTIGYTDSFLRDSPIATTTRSVFQVIDGRLRRTQNEQSFAVEPETLKRSPLKDGTFEYVDVQIE